MPKCKLNIKLEGNRKYYRVGDKISGQVEVMADKECPCNELFIEKSWHTRGKGGTDIGEAHKIVLHKGTWAKGLHRYNFEYDIEPEPLSYQGKYVNIDWYLNARADIAKAIDPKAKIDFIVTTKPNGSLTPPAYKERETELVLPQHPSIRKYIPLFLLLMLLVPAILIYQSFVAENTALLGIGLAALVLQTSISWRLIKPIFFERKLGPVKLIVDRDHYSPEDPVEVRVHFTLKQALTIDYADVKLVMTEIATTGNGKNRIHHSHTHCHGEQILTGQRPLKRGDPFDQSAKIILPYKAMHSFESNHNSLTWSVILTINIHNTPEFKKTIPISVNNSSVNNA